MNTIEKEKIIKALDNSGAIILPSDTVYGLFCDALNENAIKKIDDIKHSNKPHLILVSNIEMLNSCTKNLTELHEKLINKYWPNTLTILFEKSDIISDELTKGSNLVGVRMPKNKMLIDLINEYGKPLLSTSANITNETVITDISLLSNEIKNKVDYIYDGGHLGQVASTLIKIENNKIMFLREGALANKIKEDFKEYL